MMRPSTGVKRVHQLLVQLEAIEPAIWRRIQVPEEYDFWGLHVAIQDAMGWLDYHLHVFRIKAKHKHKPMAIGFPDEDDPSHVVRPGREVKLSNVFWVVGTVFEYEYDFGDGWQHRITHEGVLVREPEGTYPRCIGGARACPPEDSGGVGGYANVQEILADPRHKEYRDTKTWVGEGYDPERFDPAAIKFWNPKVRLRMAFEH